MTHTTMAPGESGPAIATWEPETPFLNAPSLAAPSAPAPAPSPGRPATIESPFSAEYHGDDRRAGPHAEAYATLVDELQDEEFGEALEDLVNDAGAVLEERFSGEIGDPGRERVAMERAVRDYLQPLERTSEGMLQRMADELGDKSLEGMSEGEIDTLMEGYAPDTSGMSPAFEGFLKGILKKAKTLVKKAASVVTLPHRLLLNRLKGLVQPLLRRVLRFAIDKLPVAVRPIATKLAHRFLGVRVGAVAARSVVRPPAAPATTDASGDATASAPSDAGAATDPGGDATGAAGDTPADASAADAGAIQEELDAQLAGYVLAGEAFEEESAGDVQAAASEHGDALASLEEARRDFSRSVVEQQDGEDPAPQVEQFVAAILPALRLGIRVVGRPRVVRFLAGLVSRLIARYVGQAQATSLSTALVDTGLRLVSLEAPRDDRQLAGDALAATVEDTVTRLVQSAPPAAWESESLLEAYTLEAFQQAASAHFPDPLIREELHEAATTSGAWMALPARSPRKRYRKYSHVIDVNLTPQVADAVKTFGGVPLRAFLRDRLGVDVSQPVRARMHLYQAIPGTRLSLVALHERGVSGLGHARRGAWSLFHPLTPEAAGVLANEPGLGRPVPPTFAGRRRMTAVGQRFYYLEIPGARVRIAPRRDGQASRPARSTQARVVLDFVRRQLRLALYYSEADAQQLIQLLRQKAPPPVLLRTLKSTLDAQIARILAGEGPGRLRIVHEQAPTEELAAPMIGALLRTTGRPLTDVALGWTLDALRKELETRLDQFTGEFERAAQSDEDGVTIVVSFEAPPLLGGLRAMLATAGIAGTAARIAALGKQPPASTAVAVHPGWKKP